MDIPKVVFVAGAFFVFVILTIGLMVLLKPWLKGHFCGFPVSGMTLIGLRRQGVPLDTIVVGYIAAQRAGLPLTIDDIVVIWRSGTPLTGANLTKFYVDYLQRFSENLLDRNEEGAKS